MPAKALGDRAQIQDLITRYYYNFGNPNPESFADFYADDAELILGATHYKGKDGIARAYRLAAGSGPSRKAYSFNVTISNPLIVVHGDTATCQLIFTEFLIDKQGEAPRVTTQGREYATFVKLHGHWRYKTRQIKGGTEPPQGWKE
jgi:ketosteroid isomerase-like protein